MAQILLVDDDDLLRDMLQRRLLRAGHAVLLARNGREALRVFDADTVELVLTDMAMPDMDGLKLVKELRRLQPSMKIITMTGSGREYSDETVRSSGAAWHLAKPFSGQELLSAIESVLTPVK